MDKIELDINEVMANLGNQIAQLSKEKAVLQVQVETLHKMLSQKELEDIDASTTV